METERCHLRRCRRTHLQVGWGGWDRSSRWRPPLPWNPPLRLKAPGGSSARIPTVFSSITHLKSAVSAKLDFVSNKTAKIWWPKRIERWQQPCLRLRCGWTEGRIVLVCRTSKFPSRLRLAGGALALNCCSDSSVKASLFGHTLQTLQHTLEQHVERTQTVKEHAGKDLWHV